ncbi:oligopeptide/dipeptide ABC transporter ATP-binding protein [Streptomyces virginiae]|uniref:oligopeptide/dipeptide ABC transporter ATP-binding protein n=1 Tax=Streptomyces virginiae TaxID=1961 RepID=UPI0036C06EB1
MRRTHHRPRRQHPGRDPRRPRPPPARTRPRPPPDHPRHRTRGRRQRPDPRHVRGPDRRSGPVGELFVAPRHPYTAGLLGSSPPLHGPLARLTPIPGAPMGLLESAPGCAFAPRCRFAEPGRCDQSPPPPERHGPAEVACHRTAELTAVAANPPAPAFHAPCKEDS